jgi:hypothetical protein
MSELALLRKLVDQNERIIEAINSIHRVNIRDASSGTQTNDLKVTLDSEVVDVDATGQGDVPITLDGEVPEIQGDAAEDAAVSGNPVLIGGRYDNAARILDNGDVGGLAVYPDGTLLTKEFLFQVKSGLVPGMQLVNKYGRNDAVPNGSWAHISLTPFSIANFLTAATTVRIKAGGDANDTSGGTGAREVTVFGLDSNFQEASEAIATNGASASSSTTTQFWRVYRVYVSSVGTYTGNNVANVVIENTAGTIDLITIAAGEGQTQYGGFAIDIDYTAYLIGVNVTVDSNKTANVRCFTRENLDDTSAPMSPKRLRLHWDGLQSPGYVYKPRGAEFSLNGKSDIWFEAYGDGAVSQVSVDFELLMVSN